MEAMESRKAKRSESEYPEQTLAKRPKIEPELSPKIEPNLHGGGGDERKVMEKVEEDLDDNGSYERKLNTMKLRSGKKLPPFVPGYKFRRPKQVKEKKFPPCKHPLCDQPRPDYDHWEKSGFYIIEKRIIHLNCRCPTEIGLKSVIVYDIINKATGRKLFARPEKQKIRGRYRYPPQKYFARG